MGGGHEPHLQGEGAATRSGSRIPKLKAVADGKPSVEYSNKMSLQLFMDNVRRRANMSDAEREWRKKWLLSQRLHPDEPIAVEAVYRNLNPARRLYRAPWDLIYQKILEPRFGIHFGSIMRATIPKGLLVVLGVYTVHYWIKYNYTDWQTFYGVGFDSPREQLRQYERINEIDPRLLRDHYAYFDDRNHFSDRNHAFRNRYAMRDVGETNRPW